MALVPGHTLRYEGNAYNPNGQMKYRFNDPVGHAKCSCGALSPELPSRAARKRWHKQHKAEVLSK